MNKSFLAILCGFLGSLSAANACTMFSYNQANQYLVARTFDWTEAPIGIVHNPVGGYRQAQASAVAGNLARWPILYPSVTFDMLDQHGMPNYAAVVGGMNNQGLQASVLELDSTMYPTPPTKPIVPSAMWVSYFLDQARTVPEALALAQNVDVEPSLYENNKVPLHMMLNDAAGNNAVLEYISGKLVVLTGKQLAPPVLTNNTYAESLQKYQTAVTNSVLLPGYHSQARYVRAAYLLQKTQPKTVAQGFAILKTVIEPKTSDDPTQWAVVYDLTNRKIYFTRDFLRIKRISVP